MKKPIWTPFMIFGLVWLLVVLISWAVFDWNTIPGGFWTLAGLAAVGVVAFLKDGISYLKTFFEMKAENQKADPAGTLGGTTQTAVGERARIVNIPNGTYIENFENHAAPEPEPPAPTPLIGMIPPAHADQYIHRGEVEEQVRATLQGHAVAAVVGLHAPGGTGKSEMAKQISQELRGQFDGTLWITVGEKTVEAVVGDMLRACGLKPPDGYPAQVQELKAFLAARRLLVVLDDLRSQSLEKLSDFLPPAPPCAVLITSRIEQPSHLILLRNTYELNRMTPEQARELLEASLGEQAVLAEAESAGKLMERCLWNPLALDIAARRIRQMQGIQQPIQKYLVKLQASLSELRMPDDPRLNMEKVFDQSYDDLIPADQARFAALSVFAAAGFCPQAAAMVWQDAQSTADQALQRLKNLSLITPVPGEFERYRLHDLLDEYAAEKLSGTPGAAAAYENLAAWLLQLFEEHYTDDASSAPEVALEWDNLQKVAQWAADAQNSDLLARLATRPRNWLYNYWRELEEWRRWLETALRLGLAEDTQEGKQLKANVLQAIGDVQNFRKELDAALQSYSEALRLFRAVGARLGEANVLKAIGDVQNFRDERDAALQSYSEALRLFRAVGARLGEANVYLSLGDLRCEKELEGAKKDYLQALEVYQTIGDRYSQARALYRLGDCYTKEDAFTKALDAYEQAADLWRQIGVHELVERILTPRIEEVRKHL